MSDQPQDGAPKFGPWILRDVEPERPRSTHEILVDYLFAKAQQRDWHAVRDAAVDLELLELRMKLENPPTVHVKVEGFGGGRDV
jgi:hypothetical protein